MRAKIKYVLAAVMINVSLSVMADDNVGMIVTNDGETLKVYNIDYSPADYCYYTLEADSDEVKRIKKTDILIIKLADGTKVDLSNPTPATANASQSTPAIKQNPGAHPAVTHKAVSKPSGNTPFAVTDGDKQEIMMLVLSEADKTLAVTKPRKKQDYDLEKYIIPDYVDIDGQIYTVVRIDKEAFRNIGFWHNDENIKEIVLPGTLKEIGASAFAGREGLKRIIIPDSVDTIEASAFIYCGVKSGAFEQLYIPETVKTIGQSAFWCVGTNRSYRGFYQGNLSCMPSFITTGNCKDYGIDEEAVEAYERRNR